MIMATVDWDAVVINVEDELTKMAANDHLMTKSYQTAHGGNKTFRDFKDVASLQGIRRNQEALTDRENNGLLSFFEYDDKI